jgi:predicted nucleotidyltransferase
MNKTLPKKDKVITLNGTMIAELERAYDKAHAWFFAYPTKEFSLNELQKHLGISKTTANILFSQLNNEGFVSIEKLGKIWRIKANLDHPHFISRKIPFNLQMVYESGIINWIKDNIPNNRAIILFGSYRKGDDNEESDLDIAVETISNEPIKILSGLIIKNLGYRENVEANIHIFSRNNIDLNLFSNIANGIVLDGFLEVRI